ncbi:S8 family peptidase [Paenibacillus apiarius]|uniref:S8 family peptidase n=1 Tax=Paenibacillus apiarius TaxID=46240 RepID=A0ABT4DL71_9BACL|nr:S8 family peptidase [Paenibacillus apiarius]MCY9513553.1 S8 family peptidase [Paenibacillus apiarius]MCY9518104.1 S8 family peptidase [Paenibacillus apiarius]MCY9551495.1 S8 family peptidase [Paenibacillus apiarius]MCY9558649.1 S8 family peptidase [Paenibacillus apiarius]MCY9684037.1 S8 family peptidase [Paenibacillus apiarius]
MMQRRYIVGAFALGVAVLALPLLWSSDRNSQSNGMATASQEKNAKHQILQQDMLFTGRLFAMDSRRDLEIALTEWKQHSPEQMHAMADEFVQSHPHFVYMKWVDMGKSTEWVKGQLPKDESWQTNKRIKEYIQSAKTNVMKRQSYTSPDLMINGKSHVVMGIPSPHSDHGIIALINQHVVQTVRKHQQKNLRLVPYPAESKYRVKSVDSSSMRDVKVQGGEDNAGTSHYYQNEIVVRFRKDPETKQLQQMIKDTGCEHPRKLGYTYVFRSKWMSAERMEQYFSQFNPVYIEPHFLYMTNEKSSGASVPTSQLPLSTDTEGIGVAVEEPNDALYKAYQWNLPNIHTNRGWAMTKGQKDVIVAIVDTGVDLKHRDLQGKLLEGYNVFDPNIPPQDDVGHGTHVAGIIGATVNNGEGVAGMTWYNPLLPVKALDSSGSGTSYSVAEGIIWATDNGAKVINLSLGNYVDGAFLHDAVKYAYDRDVVLIAATGNDNTQRPGYPAAYPEVFAVSATDENQKRASFSNYGNYVDVVAPGASIASTYPSNQYAALSGTSMACPHVSALAALIRSVNPGLKNTEVYDIMRQSVVDLGSPGKDQYFGYGLVDVARALSMAEQGNTSLSLFPQNINRQLKLAIEQFFK